MSDAVVVAMARHFAGWPVAAVISPLSAVAAELCRRVHRPDLAVIGALGAYDTAAGPILLKGEWGAYPTERHDVRDLFALVSQGRVAIFASPAQVDRAGRANLGGIGGWDQPKVALPGSRGLPDDAASLPGFGYWLPSPRAIVAEVDYVSAPPPPSERIVLTRFGVFAAGDSGWRAVSRHGELADLPFEVAGWASAPESPEPTPAEADALETIDPKRLRDLG